MRAGCWWIVLFEVEGGVAYAEPGVVPDETDEQEEGAIAFPEPGVRARNEGAECTLTAGILPAPVEVSVADGAASVTLPVAEGVATWRIELRAYWRRERVDWTLLADAATSVELSAPREAWFEELQDGWLSRVRAIAIGLDERGRELGRQELERLWVVWPAGPDAAPRWLDRDLREAEAPFDAWSEDARVHVAHLSRVPGTLVAVAPPEVPP